MLYEEAEKTIVQFLRYIAVRRSKCYLSSNFLTNTKLPRNYVQQRDCHKGIEMPAKRNKKV